MNHGLPGGPGKGNGMDGVMNIQDGNPSPSAQGPTAVEHLEAEYPIRALVRFDAIAPLGTRLQPGTVIAVRRGVFPRSVARPAGKFGDFDHEDQLYSPPNEFCGVLWTWYEDELILNPTDEQIAAERAKVPS